MTNVFPFYDVANILLFLFLIYSILAIFFKPDKSRIYCGIFAFCGPTNLSKNIYSMVLANTKILGLYNDDRGGDNAGIMINNNVYRTSGFQRTFKDLIKSVPLENPDPKESTVIIGHCRKGSVGSKEHINAHPFEIFKSDNDADFYMTGVHNGTVSNWEELAEKYHIDPKSMNNDSKTLLTIISRQRNLKKKSPVYKVLEQYEGFGTFIWYFQDEPDTMYVFKGASKKYSAGPVVEERPLFFYECPITKGIYFSSLEDPLIMISGDKTKVKNLTCNKVYKIKSGKSIEEAIVDINRSDQNLKPVTTQTTYSTGSDSYYETHYGHSRFDEDGGCGVGYGYGHGCGPYDRKFNDSNKNLAGSTLPKITGGSSSSSAVSSNNSVAYKTTMFDSPFFNEVYYQGRKIIYRLEGLYYGHEGKVLHGKYYVNKETNEYYPYESISPLVLVDIQKNATKYTQAAFYDGYLLRDVSTFLVVRSQLENLKNYKESKRPDFFSLYSSTVVPGIRKEDGQLKYYFSGNLANFKVENPPFSENKKYDYVHGKLVSVSVPIKYPLKEINFKKEFVLGILSNPGTFSAAPVKLITDVNEIKKEAARLNLPDVKKSSTDDVLKTLIDNCINETKNKNVDREIEEAKKLENEEDDLTTEDAFIVLSGEEEIVELLNEIFFKAEEQKELVESLVKKGMITDTDLLSSNILVWIKDTIIQSMVPVPSSNKNENEYYAYDKEKGTLEFNSEKFLTGHDKDSIKNFEIF